MRVPCREKDVNVISLIVDTGTDRIGSFTGKPGAIPMLQHNTASSVTATALPELSLNLFP